jgi:hypothetical protein
MESMEINTNVSPELHPDIMEAYAPQLRGKLDAKTNRWEREDTVGFSAYRAAREALEAIYGWHSAVEDSERVFIETVGNRSTVVRGRDNAGLKAAAMRANIVGLAQSEQELVGAAETGSARALAASERAAERIKTAYEQLGSQIDSLTDDKERKSAVGITLGTEIRNHVKGLSDAKRFEFIHERIRSGDVKTVAAILRAPSYLSGITDEQNGQFQVAVASTWTRLQYEQLTALEKVRARMEKAHNSVQDRLNKLKSTMNTPMENRAKRQAAYAKLAKGGK